MGTSSRPFRFDDGEQRVDLLPKPRCDHANHDTSGRADPFNLWGLVGSSFFYWRLNELEYEPVPQKWGGHLDVVVVDPMGISHPVSRPSHNCWSST